MKPLALTLLAATAAGLAAAGSRPLAAARFAARPGWYVGSNRVHACPGVPRSQCEQVTSWAATIRWRDCGDCIPPHRTNGALPANGIAIALMLARETKRLPSKRLAWPPDLRARDVIHGLEGVGGRARTGYISKFGRLNGFDASLWVFFGRRQPTARQLARAEAALRTTRLP